MISALEHYSYCPRQCGLIHVESVWDENVFTVRGHQVHERADEPTTRQERGKRVERALSIWSDTCGIIGKADVVEFDGETITPVEYKSGAPKKIEHASLQLCAQALCLEEMFNTRIVRGNLYFVKTKERIEVPIDCELRKKTLVAIEEIRRMIANGKLPEPVNDRRCPNCSLIDACLPGPVHRAIREAPSLYLPMSELELP